MHGRKLELEHFLSQHGVNICLLIETFLNPGQAFWLASYVCHHTDRLTAGGGTAILVRHGIVHHSVPVSGWTHLEATAIQVILAGRPVKIFAAYLTRRINEWRNDQWSTDWANFQTNLEDEIPFNPELHNGMAIDT